MKWLVYYKHIYFQGKGDVYSETEIIGYSDKDEKELFDMLKKEYPNLQVLKLVRHSSKAYDFDYYNRIGERSEIPYKDYVYFTPNNLKEF